ncbi:MaoC/PaaZ C-terminal domain-containing protein [Variovorax sp. efr-133-TYG-130]|uniref:MaoC/PaaZ C-terminal domain-containing protein n=1 Tax=Variovorax sp. efr-133-TYG-130 TaxID=3040327 RepID=UPI002556A3C1|nr:MaoC/PaaZ C-terminal domain-containing protein [Variovorax sp. efr-133-TYG-130]
MLNYQKIKSWAPQDVRHHYTRKDTILYNLGLGFGVNPLDPAELRYVYEEGLSTLPTMCSVLATPGFWMKDNPEFGIDYMRLVHGEQKVVMHRALAPEATVYGRTRVTRIVDKGAAKGALVTVERQLLESGTMEAIASIEQVYFCRGDGGFSEGGVSDMPAPADNFVATREPDGQLMSQIATSAALLYRLSGDWNPLHADPAVAKKAGFNKPILHGLATYGVACRMLTTHLHQAGLGEITSFAARLSAPVFPGDVLQLRFWLDKTDLRFEAAVAERGVRVLSNGTATLAAK